MNVLQEELPELEDDSDICEGKSKSDEKFVNDNMAMAAVSHPSASESFTPSGITLDGDSSDDDSESNVELAGRKQHRRVQEDTMPLMTPSKTEEESDILPLKVSPESREEEHEEDDLPLIIPAHSLSSSDLLCLEGEDKVVSMEEGLVISSSAAPSALDTYSSSISSPASYHTHYAEKIMKSPIETTGFQEGRPFKPIIEVMASTDVGEAEEEDTKLSEALVSSSVEEDTSLHQLLARAGSSSPQLMEDEVKNLYQSASPQQAGGRKQHEEKEEWVGISPSDDKEHWARARDEIQASVMKQENGNLVIEDLQQDVSVPLLPVPTLVPDELKQDFKLAEVPIVSEASLKHVDAILAGLEGKAEKDMSREEKVWKLAARGGSTLKEQVEPLNLRTNVKMKEGTQEAILLDKASLKF